MGQKRKNRTKGEGDKMREKEEERVCGRKREGSGGQVDCGM